MVETEIVPSHFQVAHGKIRIKFDGTLIVRQGCDVAFLVVDLSAKAVRFQSFERRRGSLFERNIKLLHRNQRFAQFAAQLGRGLTQRVQHLLLGRRRHLLLRQRISALAIHRLEPQHIFAAQTANRSGKVGLAARPLAKLAGHLGREVHADRTCHLSQGVRDFAVREHIQERRLPQGNVDRRLQRVVEHRIACGVGKIGENDGVLIGQAMCGLA